MLEDEIAKLQCQYCMGLIVSIVQAVFPGFIDSDLSQLPEDVFCHKPTRLLVPQLHSRAATLPSYVAQLPEDDPAVAESPR